MEPTTSMARTELTVRYHECDPSGIVFNADYLAYADIASLQTLESVVGPYSELAARGYDMVVAESNLWFLLPCRPGDELVAEVANRYVWADSEAKKPISSPEDVRQALAAHEVAA